MWRACSSRQLAERSFYSCSPRERISGKLPETAGWQPALPRSGALRRHVERSTLAVNNACMSTASFHIIAAEHTGFTVTSIDRSLVFWQGVLGFELSHRAHHTGDLASEVTGVPGAEISIAVLKAPGHRIELLEYHAPANRTRADLRACDVGSAHIAFTVDNIDAVLSEIAASGWRAVGKTQTLQTGPNAGKRVIYVRDPDGTTIEFMQPRKSSTDFAD